MHIARITLACLLLVGLFGEDAPASPEALKQRIAELEAQLQQLRSQSVTYKTLLELEVSPSFLRYEDDKGRLVIPDKLTTFLGLTADERKALIDLLRSTRSHLAEEIAKQKPVAEKTDSGYRLVINEFPAEGKIIEGQFLKTAGELLGPERMKLFRRCLGSSTEEFFLDFGMSTHIYQFSGRGDSWNLRHETKGEHSSGTSSGNLHSLARLRLVRTFLPKELVEGLEGAQAKADDVNDF